MKCIQIFKATEPKFGAYCKCDRPHTSQHQELRKRDNLESGKPEQRATEKNGIWLHCTGYWMWPKET